MEEPEIIQPNVWGMQFVRRQNEVATEIMEELKNSKSPRVEILVATNYAELILKDFMEFLLKDKEAREIPRHVIVNILESKELLNKELAHDVRQIFKIRDSYAHKPVLNEANMTVEKQILPNLYCVKKETPKVQDWEKRPLTQKIIDCCDWVFVQVRGDFHAMVVSSFVNCHVPKENK